MCDILKKPPGGPADWTCCQHAIYYSHDRGAHPRRQVSVRKTSPCLRPWCCLQGEGGSSMWKFYIFVINTGDSRHKGLERAGTSRCRLFSSFLTGQLAICSLRSCRGHVLSYPHTLAQNSIFIGFFWMKKYILKTLYLNMLNQHIERVTHFLNIF